MTTDNRQTEVDPVPGMRGLPMNLPPDRDLWPGIAARIVMRRDRSRAYLAAAACAVLALAAMLSLPLAPVAPPADAPAFAAPAQGAVSRITDLRANRALIKANLRLTQSAEGQVRKALRQSPRDESLRGLLRSTREQRQELHQLLLADDR